MDKPMKGFTVKINLCEDDMDDIKRLNALTKESRICLETTRWKTRSG